jgi:hypothetical protein
MSDVQAEYEAYWDCPKCAQQTTESDEGVDDDGEVFYVTCPWDVDDDDELEPCGHEYSVKK